MEPLCMNLSAGDESCQNVCERERTARKSGNFLGKKWMELWNLVS